MASNLEPTEAERTCLGAAMQSVEAMESLAEAIKAEHFASDLHRRIYASMLALHARSERVDIVTIRNEISDARATAYVAGLLDGLPYVQNVEPWARIVRENARLRALEALGALFGRWIVESGGNADLVIDRAQQALQRIHEGGSLRSFVVEITEALNGAMESIDRMAASGHGIVGVPSGLAELDELTGGFQPGALYTIGARTRRGKSVLSSQVALHASGLGKRVLLFSLEMPPAQVAKRMLMAHAGVEKYALMRGETASWARLHASYAELVKHSLEFDRHESPTLAHIKTHAARMKRAGGLDLIVVDYFQRCAVNPKMERWQGLGEFARGLKSLAQSLEVPIILPAQLNRNAEEKRPTLADLRECGDLEQESDVVMFIHPTPMPGKSPEEIMLLDFPGVDLIVEKNRHGEGRVIQLSFERRYVRFVAGRNEAPTFGRMPESVTKQDSGLRWDNDRGQ